MTGTPSPDAGERDVYASPVFAIAPMMDWTDRVKK